MYEWWENGYNASLIAYKKEVYDVKKLLPEENLFLQVFLMMEQTILKTRQLQIIL